MAVTQLKKNVDDLREEGEELEEILDRLSTHDWNKHTTFKNWTPFDVVAHLHMSDHMALMTMQSAGQFKDFMKEMKASNMTSQQYGKAWIGNCTPEELVARWKRTFNEMCEKFLVIDPEKRLTWAGPGMGPRMFITARQMETWAHGQEIYDLLKVQRIPKERLRNIAEIGVRTFGWSFLNRGLTPPTEMPFISLSAPNNQTWEWNKSNTEQSISGSALEFCQVVTQVRNIGDTAITLHGKDALKWMSIAQCFAGPPENPPLAGARAT